MGFNKFVEKLKQNVDIDGVCVIVDFWVRMIKIKN